MLRAYLDESLSKDEYVFCVAGYLAPDEEWASLTLQWKLRLEKDGVAIFHATDCANGQGEFKDWPPERRAALTRDLVDIIIKHDLTGFICGVEAEPYEEIVGPLLEKKARNLYVICLMPLLKAMADAVVSSNAPESERIAFVYEERYKTSAVVNELFDMIRRGDDSVFPFPARARLDSITPLLASDANGTMLQVADLLAYEGAKHLYNEKHHPEIIRKAMQRLQAKVIHATWLSAESMPILAEWLHEQSEAAPTGNS